MKIKFKHNLPDFQPKSWKKSEKWDKNKNNGFGLRPQKLNENQLKLAKISTKKWTTFEIMDLGSMVKN